MQNRLCTMCKQEFPASLEFFYAHPQGKLGLNNVCKACQKVKARKSELARKDTPEYRQNAAAKARRMHHKHRDARLENARRWKAANPGKCLEYTKKRNARLANGSYTAEEWAKKLSEYAGTCHWCKQPISDGVVTDHLIPVSRGGRNTIDNIVPSCHSCNQSKHAALPDEFLARRPDLQPLHT